MRAAEGHGGGKCRAGWGKRREVGLERWNEGRIGGIGVVFVGDGRPAQSKARSGAAALARELNKVSTTWHLMKKDLAGSMTTLQMVKCQSKFYPLWTHFDKPGTRTEQL